MIGIVLVTHGNLAREFLAALEHVVGPQQCVSTVCIGADDLPMLVKLASVRSRPIAEAVRMAQEAGRKYITVASRILAKEAS